MQREDVFLQTLYRIEVQATSIATSLERLARPVIVVEMEENQTCAGCLYGSDGVHCRRRAPTIISLGDKVWSGWPIVSEDDWCGEWRKD